MDVEPAWRDGRQVNSVRDCVLRDGDTELSECERDGGECDGGARAVRVVVVDLQRVEEGVWLPEELVGFGKEGRGAGGADDSDESHDDCAERDHDEL